MVSVIMAVYNTAEYLGYAINSVISQTYSDWELLAIDDGSTDDSGRMLDEWAKKDTRIRVFHTENAGLSEARNVGLRNMIGDYVQFLDSDDWLAPNAFEEALSAFSQPDIDMVIFDVYYEGMGVSFHEKSSFPNGVYDSLIILKELSRPSMPPYACNKFCKQELYQGVFFPVGEKWEDVATTFYPVSCARKIAILDKPLYYYRQRPEAITKTAIEDHSIHKWRFLQYRKRYDFLKQFCPTISAVAKTSVLKNGILYYAWFSKHLPKIEKDELYHYLCSEEFRSGISSRRVIACRSLFRILPGLTSCMIRKHMN